MANPERPLLHRVLANAGVLLGGRTVNAVISLGYMAVAARLLGVREVGVLILINAFAQFLGEVVKFKSWQTVLHYGSGPLAAGERGKLQQVVRFTLFLDVASSLDRRRHRAWSPPCCSATSWAGPRRTAQAALYCLTILVMASATPIGLLRLFDRFDLIAGPGPDQLAGAAGRQRRWPFAVRRLAGRLPGRLGGGTVVGLRLCEPA